MFVGWLKTRFVALKIKFGSMRKSAVKDQLYGSILEMMNDHKLFYRSDIGKRHEYSHWTPEGKEELMEFLEEHTRRMLVVEEALIRDKAKEMTFETLKAKE